jgi:Flp pilus assembly protein TadD
MALASLYGKTNRYEGAIAKTDEAVKLDPKNITAHMLMGVLHQQRGATAEAEKSYKAVLDLNPRFAPAANNLAYLYSANGGDKEKALSLARAAKEGLPDDPSVADTLGWILYKRGSYDGALSQLVDSAAKLTDNPEVQYHLGMTHYKLGNTKAARQSLSHALKLSTKFAGASEAKEVLEKLERRG